MPKHAFKFPPEVVQAIKRHVLNAVEAIEPSRYRQEPNYTAALVTKLQGVAYEGEHGSVEFHSTVFDDRGPRSAEHKFGADFAITATITVARTTVRKAILVQAKLGSLDELNNADTTFLKGQIRKMKQIVAAPKVMEIPEHAGHRYPAMISGNQVLADEPYIAAKLPEYFAARVMTTLDGCTDPKVVEAVQDSSLLSVDIVAKVERNG